MFPNFYRQYGQQVRLRFGIFDLRTTSLMVFTEGRLELGDALLNLFQAAYLPLPHLVDFDAKVLQPHGASVLDVPGDPPPRVEAIQHFAGLEDCFGRA